MNETIQIKAADGHEFSACVSGDSASSRGIVLVQEIFGVNEHIRNVADRYAREGFYVVAPALFDRAERNVELHYNEAGISHGVALVGKIAPQDTLRDVEAALAHLGTRAKTIIGFCWGGTIAWQAAGTLMGLTCAVGFYGGGIAASLAVKPLCPVQLHFGEQDPHIPMADVDAIRQAAPDVEILTYPDAGHGFCCDARGSFHAQSEALAKRRVLEFLTRHMV
jgi:carboxymethylenebutenolidase